MTHRPPATGRPMIVVWITLTRGVMAILLGLALAVHKDRAPAALANFMGIYWILMGMVTLQGASRRRSHAGGCRSSRARSGS